MIRINKKELMAVLIMVLSTGFTGCSNTPANTSKDAGDIRSTEIYNGTTNIYSFYGNWTPPKGARKSRNGTIVDSSGAVIGNDGTWKNDGKGLG